MTIRSDRGGAGVWVVLIIFVVGAWAGYQIGKLYFEHSQLETEIKAVADGALTARNRGLKKEIIGLFSFYGVTMDPEDVEISF